MNIYEKLGVRTIINAKGTATRLSGASMRTEVSAVNSSAVVRGISTSSLPANLLNLSEVHLSSIRVLHIS